MPETPPGEGEPVILPYWVRDHIRGQLIRLTLAWLEWRSKDGYKPGTLCPRGAPSPDWWKVEEMGYALQEMEDWEQVLIVGYLLKGR